MHIQLKQSGNPFVPDINNIFSYNNTEYIVMNYEQGKMLRSLIKNETLSVYKTVMYMIAILNALETLHNKHILHLDISPDNIFISDMKINSFNAVKLIDFNNCLDISDTKADYINLLINSYYSAPELKILAEYGTIDDYKLTYSTDLYSLCIIFYEIIIGTDFLGSLFIDREYLSGKLQKHNLCPLAIETCIRIIKKGLESNFNLRYQNISELKKDFFDILNFSDKNFHILYSSEMNFDKHYIKRNAELKMLDKKLKSDRFCCIYGKPHTGKSAFINTFCQVHQGNYKIISTLSYFENIRYTIASSKWSNIENEQNMSVEELYCAKKALLLSSNIKTLLIIDNASFDNYLYLEIAELLNNKNLYIIITTSKNNLFCDNIALKDISHKEILDMHLTLGKTVSKNVHEAFCNLTSYNIYLSSIFLQQLSSAPDATTFAGNVINAIKLSQDNQICDESSFAQLIYSEYALKNLTKAEFYSIFYLSLIPFTTISKSYFTDLIDMDSLFKLGLAQKNVLDISNTDIAVELRDICLYFKNIGQSHYFNLCTNLVNAMSDYIDKKAYTNKIELHKLMLVVQNIEDIMQIFPQNATNLTKLLLTLKLKIYICTGEDYQEQLKTLLKFSNSEQNKEQISMLYEFIIYMSVQVILSDLVASWLTNEFIDNSVKDYLHFCKTSFGETDRHTLHAKNIYYCHFLRNDSI